MSADEDRAELARLEEAWMQAVADRDMDTLERLVAPGFRFMAIHLYPEPMTRAQWMDAAREGYTIVSFAFEAMEIASYTILIRTANHVGDRETARICKEILKEEKAMASWLEKNMPALTQQYLRREEKGLVAKH